MKEGDIIVVKFKLDGVKHSLKEHLVQRIVHVSDESVEYQQRIVDASDESVEDQQRIVDASATIEDQQRIVDAGDESVEDQQRIVRASDESVEDQQRIVDAGATIEDQQRIVDAGATIEDQQRIIFDVETMNALNDLFHDDLILNSMIENVANTDDRIENEHDYVDEFVDDFSTEDYDNANSSAVKISSVVGDVRDEIDTEHDEASVIVAPSEVFTSKSIPARHLSRKRKHPFSGSGYVDAEGQDITMQALTQENIHYARAFFDSTPGENASAVKDSEQLPVFASKQVFVSPLGQAQQGRLYDKRYFCVYCDKPFAKIRPHLVSQHGNEIDVAEMLSKGSKSERERLLTKLRNTGNHKHNCETITTNSGSLCVVYRPSPETDTSMYDYLPCPHCLGYYDKKQLWKHVKHRCVMKTDDARNFTRVISKARFLMPVAHSVTSNTREILSHMKHDDVYFAVINDEILMEYAQKLTSKHYADPDRHVYVRDKVRQLGRLLVVLKTQYSVNSISESIAPPLFQTVLSAVKFVAGFDAETNEYTTPSLALHLGHALKKCAVIQKSKGLQQCNKLMQEQADAFVQLCEIEWSDEISGKALKTLHARKFNKVTILPLANDIASMSKHLAQLADESLAGVKSSASLNQKCKSTFKTLAEVTLVQLIMFNRRRSGEVSKMRIEMFSAASNNAIQQSDVTNHLSAVEVKLCNILMRVEIPGKRGNIVPVLMTAKYKEQVECIINHRESGDIPATNSYVFAQANSEKHLSGCDNMRKYSSRCGAKCPQSLRSTALRKHVATLSQVLNLKDNELDILAQFMGHDIRVHREYYRLPSNILQSAKVAKLLLAMESGQQHALGGQSLDDIVVDFEEGL